MPPVKTVAQAEKMGYNNNHSERGDYEMIIILKQGASKDQVKKISS